MVVETHSVQVGIITHDRLVYVVELWIPFKLLELDKLLCYYTDHVCVNKEWWYTEFLTLKLFFLTILFVKEISILHVLRKHCVCSNFENEFKVLLPCLHSIWKKIRLSITCLNIDFIKTSIHTPDPSLIILTFSIEMLVLLFFWLIYSFIIQFYFWAGKQYLSVDNHITYYSW